MCNINRFKQRLLIDPQAAMEEMEAHRDASLPVEERLTYTEVCMLVAGADAVAGDRRSLDIGQQAHWNGIQRQIQNLRIRR
jgi:hypothetical protein